MEKKSRVRVAVDDAMKKVYALFGKEEFEVETPSAVTGIRGTDFIVDVDDDGNTIFLLNEGSIIVRSKYDNSEITLSPGQKIIAPINSTLSAPEDLTSDDKKAFSADITEEESSSPLIYAALILILVIIVIIIFVNRTKSKKKAGNNKSSSAMETNNKKSVINTQKYCTNCKTPLSPASKFCKNCGNKVEE